MQFTISAAALAAFVGSVVAQNPNFNPVYRPESGEELQSGSTFTIEWEAPAEFADVEISISLIGGATQNTQVPLLDIACKSSRLAQCGVQRPNELEGLLLHDDADTFPFSRHQELRRAI